MAWPHSQDYNEAIQSPPTCFSDAELKQGQAVTNALGLPTPCSGNFADVYAVECPATKSKWAVKCFTREIAGLKERYREISAYLKQTPLPFMVDFTYIEQGIRVRGQWYPILKMRWIEGFALNEFVKNHIDKPQVLDVLSQIWVKLAAKLREAQIAHCDLQHGNVLLVPGSKASSLAVKLVDYDGMCVPALTMLKSAELGHPNFQHPQRAKDGIYSLEVDRFSHLVIYTGLRALMADKALWQKFDNGDNLLFGREDFENPGKSALIAELARSSDTTVRKLTEALRASLSKPLDQVPLLHELAAASPAAKVAAAAKTTSAPAAEDIFASATTTAESRKKPRPQKSSVGLIAAGVIGLVVLIGGVAAFVAMSGKGKEDRTKEPVVVQKNPDEPRQVVPEKDKTKLPPLKDSVKVTPPKEKAQENEPKEKAKPPVPIPEPEPKGKPALEPPEIKPKDLPRPDPSMIVFKSLMNLNDIAEMKSPGDWSIKDGKLEGKADSSMWFMPRLEPPFSVKMSVVVGTGAVALCFAPEATYVAGTYCTITLHSDGPSTLGLAYVRVLTEAKAKVAPGKQRVRKLFHIINEDDDAVRSKSGLEHVTGLPQSRRVGAMRRLLRRPSTSWLRPMM